MKKLNYDVKKNYKFLKAMEPSNYDSALTWIFLIVGAYFYTVHPEYDSLLGILAYGFLYKFSLYVFWCLHSIIHAIICKKKKVTFDGTPSIVE